MQTFTRSAPTLATTLWNAKDRPTQAIRAGVLVLLGSALLTASAKVQIPFWPVPMTMQTFAVLAIAMAYGARLGAVTVLAYLAQGAVGLPVFATGAGLAYMAGPTGGYLLGFVLAAGAVGCLAERGWDRSILRTLAAMIAGTLIIYAFGLGWLATFLAMAQGIDFSTAAERAVIGGMLPFLPGEAFKIALAAAVLPLAWKQLASRNRS